MNKIDKALARWVSLGLMDQQQATRIQEYEETQSNPSWIIFGFILLGVIIIGIGVLSIVAANWKAIPDHFKLAADFFILIVSALLILRAHHFKKNIAFEALLLFFLLFNLASIGLISQIYNTGGELYQALMFWSLITMVAAAAAESAIVPFIWITGFLGSLFFTLLNVGPHFSENPQALVMALPLFCILLTTFSKQYLHEGTTRAFQVWIFVSGLIAIAASEAGLLKITSFVPFTIGYTLAAIIAFECIRTKTFNFIQKSLLLAILVIFLILFHLTLFPKMSILQALLTISMLGLLAIFMASLKNRRLFQMFLVLAGIRFLCLYFEAIGGLALTGLGLIISGIFIISMVILWGKYRKALALWAERWTQ